ncbi:sigma-54-dependent transcriptional regulator [Alteromonas facilis]|uniref:sigma-54-dependent transcriptional regulator n=1 Tax=Alteromonas facilis TaxID=2048004 RepID=UPI000C294C71|nr:sigma-54 dependent transcriptional regulator [Alteromonas facilis]
MEPVILVVDDQVDLRLSTRLVLNNYGYTVLEADSPEQALRMLDEKTRIDLVLLDMNYNSDTTSGEEGLWFLKKLQETSSNIPVVPMTAWASIELAVKAMQLGASNFIEKPWKNQRLLQVIKQQLQINDLQKENRKLKQQQRDKQAEQKSLVWESSVMTELMNKLQRLARSDAAILLTGENGTGKSSVAQFIHENSSRSEGDFISVNMGAIPESLFESEMFGHIKGAFTDAKENRIGRFELAENGTLFLDEIANIPMSLQGKLLRVLEEGYFERVGSSVSQKANVRLVCATNANLTDLIEQGLFRADLYFRLNTLEVNIPALRHRQEDIFPLAQQFLKLHGHKYGLGELELSASAIDRLHQYHWPGNVRELGHIVERAVLLADQTLISGKDIDLGTLPSPAELTKTDIDNDIPLIPLVEAEQNLIKKALTLHNGNVQAAAKVLGITDSALYRRMEKFKIVKSYVNGT